MGELKDNENDCRAFGIRGYVMKPVVIKEFADTIRDVLDASERPDG